MEEMIRPSQITDLLTPVEILERAAHNRLVSTETWCSESRPNQRLLRTPERGQRSMKRTDNDSSLRFTTNHLDPSLPEVAGTDYTTGAKNTLNRYRNACRSLHSYGQIIQTAMDTYSWGTSHLPVFKVNTFLLKYPPPNTGWETHTSTQLQTTVFCKTWN